MSEAVSIQNSSSSGLPHNSLKDVVDGAGQNADQNFPSKSLFYEIIDFFHKVGVLYLYMYIKVEAVSREGYGLLKQIFRTICNIYEDSNNFVCISGKKYRINASCVKYFNYET